MANHDMNSTPSTFPFFSTAVVYFICLLCIGGVDAMLGPSLIELASNTESSLSQMGGLFTARAIGFMIASLWVGKLFDRFHEHWLIAGGLLLGALLMGIIPVTSSLWVLMFSMILVGLLNGTIDIGGSALLFRFPKEQVSPYMNALHFFFGVGALLSPILLAQSLAYSGTIDWAYWGLAGCMALLSLKLMVTPPPPKKNLSASTATTSAIPWQAVIGAGLILFLYVGSEVAFGGWIYAYAIQFGIADETLAAYLTSTFWAAITVGRLITIPLARRFHPHVILLGNLIGSLGFLSFFALWPDPVIGTWVGTLGFGLAMSSIFPTTLVWVERHVPLSGQVTGFIFGGGSLGAMTLPWLIGQWIESAPSYFMIVVLFANLLIALGILIGFQNFVFKRASLEA